VVETTAGATEAELTRSVSAWILPRDRPEVEGQKAQPDYRWSSPAEVGPEILSRSTRVDLVPIPAERDDAPVHSFKVQVPVGAHLYVRIAKGMRSFGGYVLAKEFAAVQRVQPFPREVKVAQAGALLSLAGEKKVSVFARDVDGLRFEVARVLPGQVAHLVTQSRGSFADPQFESYRFGPDDLTERFEEKRPLQKMAPGKAQYAGFDLGRYLGEGGGKQGLFLFKVESWDPVKDRATGTEDRRFLLVTDLGLVAKTNADRSHDLFVQHIHSGLPASGVTVQVLGRNGLPTASATTDADGHVRMARLDDFKHEKAPVAWLARRGDDVSFLPFQRSDRRLELSRFDVGGLVTGGRPKLDAYLFSDRGLYRPGDLVHLGLVVKSPDWRAQLAGVPLEVTIADPRGLEVHKERVALPASGFSELSRQLEESASTGSWAASVYLVEANGRRGALLGSTTVRVEEFLPDRLRISAHLSAERVEGWVSPRELTARVSLQNLFGTPAESRRIAAEVALSPAQPAFRAWKDYVFSDPLQAKSGFSERLEDGQTDAKGEATFALGLERFAKGSYRLTFSAMGYEAGGGRGVTAAATAMVSPLPYLVGYKPDGELRYVSRGSERGIRLVAVGPDLSAIEVKGLEAELLEQRWVSVLARQRDGAYRYESVRRESSRGKKPMAIPAKGLAYPLPTGDAGDFLLVVRDAERTELAKVPFSVAGSGNVARTLEKNAELQVKLSRADWSPGEAIQLEVTAPYVGAGLITIERDRVYAWKWFKTATTRSTHTIQVPAELEGNGYVSVAFVRALDSPEIFTSPLSHGVAPFSVSRERRTVHVELSAPALARPGEPFPIRYRAQKAGKAVVFAVDEGILQVARYATPDPLGHFFQKRALEVRTDQILDLVLPEFSVVQALSASGGDQGQAALARNLNPFKRKRDPPAVYWSGIVDVDEKEREVTWTVPETFQGAVRVMAVAVVPGAVGAASRPALVRGHFALSPNVPTFVAPGDAFEISVGVANNVEGSGKAAVKLTLATSGHLEILDGGERALEIAALREGSAAFRLRAKGALGSASLRFTASLGDKRGQQSVDLSVRPGVPFQTLVLSGLLRPGQQEDVAVTRRMSPEYRVLEVSASPLPLGLARGLIDYLAKFPYGCTEQLVSQAFPAVVLRGRPELGYGPGKVETNLAAALRMLRSRQNAEGAFGMWAGNGFVSDFQTIYALHFLTEARERQVQVPQDLLQRGLDYARGLLGQRSRTLADARLRAYAIYVLTRNGLVSTREVAALREEVEGKKIAWRKDLTAVYLAATSALLKQEGQAASLLGDAALGTAQQPDYASFYDGLVYDAQLLYVMARHFPDRLRSLPPGAIEALVGPVARGSFNTLSSAYAILALDAYARAAGSEAERVEATVTEVLGSGQVRPLALPAGLFPRVPFSDQAAQLRIASTAKLPVFWGATLAGFDEVAPKAEVKEKLELFREYQAAGRAAGQAGLGEEVEVRLKLRSLGQWHSNVAVVDLLPGGFEPVLEERARTLEVGAGVPVSGRAGDAEPDQEDGGGEMQPAPSGALPIGTAASTWRPVTADVREDRVVLYGAVGPEAREFVYRIRATNRGEFAVPPPFAESMYDRSVKARGLPGRIRVGDKAD
jgi:alpha-2-macroglobulin